MAAHLHIQTPMFIRRPKAPLEKPAFYLKMEALQPSGSFKLRGIGHACRIYLREKGAKRLWSSSGGNAGVAVAYSGKELNVPVSVVVPTTTSQRARNLIESYGADLIVHGNSWNDAHEYALSQKGPDEAYVHPFDDPLLWEGYDGMMTEVLDAVREPDAIVVAVGGGGLLGGILRSVNRFRLDVPIYAVETTGTASFSKACQAGKPVMLDSITGVATSLGAKQVSQRVYEESLEHDVRSVMVSDEQAVNACYQFLDDYRVLVEPACGAALSLMYQHESKQSELLDKHKRVMIVVCGGVGITLDLLNKYKNALKG